MSLVWFLNLVSVTQFDFYASTTINNQKGQGGGTVLFK